MVDATTYFDRPDMLAEISAGLGVPMRGLEMSAIPEDQRLAPRGW
jgi:pyridoxal 5'-phosphate synthase pdxS subunit